MDKNDVIQILKDMEINLNIDLKDYFDRILKMDEDELKKTLDENSIYTKDDFKYYIEDRVNSNSKFIKLNDLFQYGINLNTMHIHTVPKDKSFYLNLLNKRGLISSELQLIDALEKLQDIISNTKKFKNVKQIYAVSSIIKGPISRLFENLQFDVKTMKIEEAKDDKELKHFYELFKDKKNLGRAKIPVKKLFSQEWINLKENRKKELNFKLRLEEVNDLAKIDDLRKVEEVFSNQIESKENIIK